MIFWNSSKDADLVGLNFKLCSLSKSYRNTISIGIYVNKKDKLDCDKSANRSLESSFGEGKRKQRRTPEEEGFQQAADLLGSALQHEVWDRGKTACTHENTPGMKTKSDLFFNWLISLISQLGIWPSVLKWTEGLSYDIWLFEIIFYNKSVKVYEHLQYWHSSIITIIRHSISQLFGWEI